MIQPERSFYISGHDIRIRLISKMSGFWTVISIKKSLGRARVSLGARVCTCGQKLRFLGFELPVLRTDA